MERREHVPKRRGTKENLGESANESVDMHADEAPQPVPAHPRRRKLLRIVGWTAAGVALVVVVAANVATVLFGETIDSYLSTDKVDVSKTDYEAQMARDAKLSEQVEGEGLVLVRNEGNALPLSSDVAKVNVFGWGATQWVGGGSGSGGVSGDCKGILDALTEQGVSYNEDLISMYRSFQSERPYLSAGTLGSTAAQFCRLYEPQIDDEGIYTPQLLSEAKDYSNTAIVVLSRVSGESIDCPREQYRINKRGGPVVRSMGRSYLDTTPEEDELLAYVAANYEKVIVLVNSTNAMQLGVVEDTPGIDACVLVGATGTGGAAGVVKALWGEVNPSGRTTDTYAYDLSTAASWANSGKEGEGLYVGSQGLYPADGTPNVNEGIAATYSSLRFVDYTEGIYVGYRWYETADAEGFWDDRHSRHGSGYSAVVQYPFGYGLSYTSFSWEIVDRSPRRNSWLGRDDQINMTVRVTNTGGRAGKDVVELYVTPPYSPGGIEKPSTKLVAFAKTDEISPGQSQDVTLSFSVRDMASYDCYDANGNGFCGYELEAGSYKVELKRDVHTLADCEHASASYTVANGIRYDTDVTTGRAVSNRFTGSSAEDGISVDGSSTGQSISYLTRADFKGTFPTTRDLDRSVPDAVRATNIYGEDQARAQDKRAERSLGDDAAQALGSGATSSPIGALSKDGELTSLGRELGQDYDSPQWDALLDHISQGDMERIVLHGYSGTGAIDAIGKDRLKDLDGSSQAASFHQLSYGVGFPNPTTLAQTWNKSLAHSYGQAVGMECAMLGIDGWYAPACNIHRSPLGGRNYEYYSEDPLISGSMAAQTIQGSRETGTYTYLKHLVLNEQDSYRDSLYTWLTEQSLREIYLEPFRIAVGEGGATGIMTSYNRIGAVWTGGSHPLITDVLRGEWGFKGSVITDYSDHHRYMNADQMLRAGGSLFMDGVFRDGSFSLDKSSPNYSVQLRRATKDILYIWLNARSANLSYNEAAQATGAAVLARPIKTRGVSAVAVGIALIDAVTLLGLVVKAHRYLKRKGLLGKRPQQR